MLFLLSCLFFFVVDFRSFGFRFFFGWVLALLICESVGASFEQFIWLHSMNDKWQIPSYWFVTRKHIHTFAHTHWHRHRSTDEASMLIRKSQFSQNEMQEWREEKLSKLQFNWKQSICCWRSAKMLSPLFARRLNSTDWHRTDWVNRLYQLMNELINTKRTNDPLYSEELCGCCSSEQCCGVES